MVLDTAQCHGGHQVHCTPEGYAVPLNVHNGLFYIDMSIPNKDNLTCYPHSFITSDSNWDPAILDNEYFLTWTHLTLCSTNFMTNVTRGSMISANRSSMPMNTCSMIEMMIALIINLLHMTALWISLLSTPKILNDASLIYKPSAPNLAGSPLTASSTPLTILVSTTVLSNITHSTSTLSLNSLLPASDASMKSLPPTLSLWKCLLMMMGFVDMPTVLWHKFSLVLPENTHPSTLWMPNPTYPMPLKTSFRAMGPCTHFIVIIPKNKFLHSSRTFLRCILSRICNLRHTISIKTLLNAESKMSNA